MDPGPSAGDSYQTREKLASRYAKFSGPSLGSLPLAIRQPLETAEKIFLFREYLYAASEIDSDDERRRRFVRNPWYQLIGQSLELALKAGIDAAGAKRKNLHDLCKLTSLAEAAGFVLDDPHAHALIVHLDSIYHKDLESGSMYGARHGGHGGGTVPDHERLAIVISSSCEHAETRNRPLLNALG